MATVMLSAVGAAVGGPVGGYLGRLAGSYVDKAVIGALTPERQTGARLAGLQWASTAEGAATPAVFGRARVAGQVIWAARFKEKRVEAQTGGGKGGPSSYSYTYSLSFAVAVAEGPIGGVGRIWADGQPMDLSGLTMRTYLGGPEQTPDPLIEAVEGTVPAYRGVAYVVFEDLPLGAYGNRPPQLNFEVFRRPSGAGVLEDRLLGVCLIPGAGEFVLATEPVLRREALTFSAAENVNNASGRPDLLVSLDQLQAQLPNVSEVTLVLAWFGSDLRAGVCQVRPGVDQAQKLTIPQTWSVDGTTRETAHRVSRTPAGGAAYGGTPSDATVLQAIAELKARGLKVGLYPFVLMDVAPGNALPDPYGGTEQAAYPWRGRITCHPATGRPGSPDKTAEADAQARAFFAAGFRRMVLHYAALAAQAGGVDTLLIGSELRGLSTVRGAGGDYPAVAALRALAQDAKAVVGAGTAVGYAADWSEWFGHQPADGSGDAAFHLDPLWSDPAVDFVGVDFYPPLADWRDGEGGLDAAAGFAGPHDAGYLAANVAGGEDFDWFYASAADRAAQARTPITDGAYGEPWVYRAKDLVSWWSNSHHDRPGGVRRADPTAWRPAMKPIRLVEFGCPAVDRGADAPNLFVDAKSSESALPPASTGLRDDLGQRRALEAVLTHFDAAAANPTSPVYGGPMLEAMSAWCWDARPYPDFPARDGVWADAPDWTLGHWLNGRVGALPVAELAAALAARAGIGPEDFDASGARGLVTGYVVAEPMSVADALAPLAAAFAFDAAERDGRAALVDRDAVPAAVLACNALALADDQPASLSPERTLSETPDLVRVRYIDQAADYQTGSAVVRAATPGGAGPRSVALDVVGDEALALSVGARVLARALAEKETLTLDVGPLDALRWEPGDVIAVEGVEGRLRVTRADASEQPRLSLARAEDTAAPQPAALDWRSAPAARPQGPPAFLMIDLPPLEGFEADGRPIAVIAADPWTPYDVAAGPSASTLTVRGHAAEAAVVGQTLDALPAGPLHRFDRATRLHVRVEGGVLSGASEAAVLNGANACAVQGEGGAWEVIQFTTADLVSPGVHALAGLLRGQCGSDPAMAASTPAGAAFVLLTPGLARAAVSLSERGLPLIWRAAPSGAPPGGSASAQTTFAWAGLGDRPWSPAHLTASRTPAGDVALSWVRRARLSGDVWDGEPPLGEEAETYRVEVSAGGRIVRAWMVATPSVLYAAADLAADFPHGPPTDSLVRVAQGSAVFGWGAAATRLLTPQAL